MVIVNMQAAGYSEEDCNTVCRALFLDQSDEDMKAAWYLFAKGASDIDTDTFKRILPLMGDNVPLEEIEALFALEDDDNSGTVDFSEFIMLVKSMNPQSGPPLRPARLAQHGGRGGEASAL
jgi:Ca2+-binding EF-hand superfamily protein